MLWSDFDWGTSLQDQQQEIEIRSIGFQNFFVHCMSTLKSYWILLLRKAKTKI